MAAVSLIRGLGRAARELRTGAAYASQVPARRQLDVWRHGFYANHSLLYDFDRFGFDAYVSDLARATRIGRLNRPPQRQILDDKLATFLYLREIGVPTPAVFGIARSGDTVFFDERGRRGGLAAVLEDRGRVVVKPRGASGGADFGLLERRGGVLLLNEQPIADLSRCTRGSVVISEFVEQHPYAGAVYPHAVNTLRLVTLRDPDDGEQFVAFAMHRFGTQQSRPVDNVSKGGLTAHVDVADGTIGPLAALPGYSFAGTGPARWSDAHPETGTHVAGTTVPHWSELTEGVRRLAAAMPGCEVVGWDVVVTPAGFTVIEGNNRPAVQVLQVHRPLLADARVRRFFEHHGVVGRRKRSANHASPRPQGSQPSSSRSPTSSE